jgi:hypothetical protein
VEYHIKERILMKLNEFVNKVQDLGFVIKGCKVVNGRIKFNLQLGKDGQMIYGINGEENLPYLESLSA